MTRTVEQMRETLELVASHPSMQSAADAAGVSRTTLLDRHRVAMRAAERGVFGTKAVVPGYRISQASATRDANGNLVSESIQQKPAHGEAFELPDRHVIKGISALLDGEGREIVKWIKTKTEELTPLAIAEMMTAAFDRLDTAHVAIPAPVNADADVLNLFPLADLHLGLYAWGPESGANWDTSIAVARYRETMLQVAARSPIAALAVVLIGGDFLHADTNAFRTQSGNVLDGDGRTDKVIDMGIELAVFQVDLALQRHEHVLVRVLKGNHDEYASIAIVHGLAAWYRNDPRVTVDKDPSLYWFYLHGRVLLGAAHGHNVKVTEMPMIMANRRARDWGESIFRYIHMFHIHHKTQHVFEGGGVIAESHQSPVAQDSYHSSRGYLSGRSMQSITYHRERGEDGRSIVAIL